jgi:hypothetical protein
VARDAAALSAYCGRSALREAASRNLDRGLTILLFTAAFGDAPSKIDRQGIEIIPLSLLA